MKRFTFFLLLLFTVCRLQTFAQSYNRNFVLTRTFLNSQGTSSMDRCQYYDDLGRDDQWVQMKVTPNGGDLYSAIQYDSVGRKWRESVPVVSSSSNGGYLADVFKRAQLSNVDQYPFSETGYENSPLNRVLSNTGAGAAWHEADKRTRQAFFINDLDTTGLFYTRCYAVDSNYVLRLVSPSIYKEGELRVGLAIDEDNDSTLTFKDKQDQTLLIRQRTGGVSHDTYYVYNDYGLLCYVLPPATEGRTDVPTLSLYAYSYQYDHRNRCIEKKLPGCDPVYMVYDRSDRIVLEQNGRQRISNRWTVSKYGNLGRLLYSFEHTDTTQVDALRAKAEHLLVYESSPMIGSDTDPFGIGYTDRYLSWGSDRRLLTVNYYDDYSYLAQLDSALRSALSFSLLSGYDRQPGNSMGVLTGSRQYLLDDSGDFLFMALYYDKKGRVVQKHAMNACGGFEHEYSAYTFTDNLSARFHRHTRISSLPELTEEYTYKYDHADRLTQVCYSFNGSDRIVLNDNSYDGQGRLQKKSLHNLSYVSTYTYNIRNWLTGISGNSFNQRLYYQDGVGIPCYNGNISSMTWKTDTETLERGYRFAYDGMKRLVNAVYGEGSVLELNLNRFNEQVTKYDKMGNIIGLKRCGQTSATEYGLIDDLSFTLNGNQLMSVDDASVTPAYGNDFNFNDGASTSIEYEYDANGNLTKDLNKKILNIQYNCLNLPSRIDFEDGNRISFLYDASGTKLSATHVVGNDSTRTDYCSNVIYENGNPRTLSIDGGYITLNDDKYHYFIQDHQGNNRVVISQNGTVEEVNHYYPFGGIFVSSQSVQSYKYNGKELDRRNGLNWYDYGARHYDAVLGRWHVVDPLAEKYYLLSSYGYCNNNPICNRDEEGKFINNIIGAVIGGAVDLGVQVAANIVSGNGAFENIDWVSVGASTIEGGLTSGLSAGKTLAVKVGVTIGKNVINGIKDNNNVSAIAGNIVEDVITDKVVGKVASILGKGIKGAAPELSKKIEKTGNRVILSNNKATSFSKKLPGVSNTEKARQIATSKNGIVDASKTVARLIQKSPENVVEFGLKTAKNTYEK